MRRIVTVFFASILLTITPQFSNSLQFKAFNNATATPGGARFDKKIGLAHAELLMSFAVEFATNFFSHSEDINLTNVTFITLTLADMSGVANTIHENIFVSANFIGEYTGNNSAGDEFVGIVYRQVARVWQWDGNSTAPLGLVEGISDYMRLWARCGSGDWVEPGGGSRWDEGYDVSARFLDYCSRRKENNFFIAKLNAGMKYGYCDEIFLELLGMTVDELWKTYKAIY